MNIMQCQWYSSNRAAATNTTEPVLAGTEPDLSRFEKVPGNHRSTPKKMLAAYTGPYTEKSRKRKLQFLRSPPTCWGEFRQGRFGGSQL